MKVRLKAKSLIPLLALGFSLSATAAEKITVGVNGMVCSFCAQGIEKKFKANDAVQKIDVKLEKHEVTLDLKDGKNLTDDEITQLLKASGYGVEKITRQSAAE